MDSREVSVKGFIESSFTDWPGKVAAVVFLAGCNFRCPFCHNPDLVLNPGKLEDFPLETVVSGIRENADWLGGVVVTGGEPTVSPGLVRLLESIRETGLAIRLDTNGSRPDVLKDLIKLGLLDSSAMDVKAPLDDERYSRAAGVPVQAALVRESIKTLTESGLEVAFRTTVVPGLHDVEAIRAIRDGLGGRPLTLQNFRPVDTLDPLFSGIKPFSAEEFETLKRLAVLPQRHGDTEKNRNSCDAVSF